MTTSGGPALPLPAHTPPPLNSRRADSLSCSKIPWMRFCPNDADQVLPDASSMVWVCVVRWWGPPTCVSSHTTVPTGPAQLPNLHRGQCSEASQLPGSGIPKPKAKKSRNITHFLSLAIAYIHRKE